MNRCLIVLNAAAGGGRAEALWPRVRAEAGRCRRAELIRTDAGGRWKDAVRAAAAAGIRSFIAAGGDGTVSQLANQLVAISRGAAGELPLSHFELGAIGLGSSNDFHKPLGPGSTSGGVPIKINPTRLVPRDVGVARYRSPSGKEETAIFLLSASVGVVAEANRLFNASDGLSTLLKRHAKGLAILQATIRAIASHRNIGGTLWRGEEPWALGRRLRVTNICVMKTQHLSGTLRFDTKVAPDDGFFAVNTCEGMGRAAILRTLVDLHRGRFAGRPGRKHLRARALRLQMEHSFALELDGEVVRATRVSFGIYPERIRVCS